MQRWAWVHRGGPLGGAAEAARGFVVPAVPVAFVRFAVLALVGLAALPGGFAAQGPQPLSAQGVLERTPNLEGGWTGAPGVLHAHVVHRFWSVGPGTDDKLVNSPTMLLAAPLPGRTLIGGRFASNSLLARDRFNEWELLARWVPFEGPMRIGVTGAWNTAAAAPDAELSVDGALPLPEGTGLPGVRLLGAFRVHGDDGASGRTGWSGAGGVVLRLSDGAAAAFDLGYHTPPDDPRERTWGAGLQLRIPATPHTMSLQATNTRTATVRGGASAGRTVWGFEFTVPLILARYLPGRGRGGTSSGETEGAPPEPATLDPGPEGRTVEVTMSDLAFVPDTLRIPLGTTVTWRNTSELVHTVTAHPERVRSPDQVRLPPGAEPFDSGNLFTGQTFQWRFDVPGTYRYLCVPHDAVGMIGVIIVDP
jgi:plastocyanin